MQLQGTMQHLSIRVYMLRQGSSSSAAVCNKVVEPTKLKFSADVGAQPEQDVQVFLLCLVQKLKHVLQVPVTVLEGSERGSALTIVAVATAKMQACL